MQHCDDETLALWALGESIDSPDDAAHLDVCAECRAELEALRATVATGRSGGVPSLVAPPPRVWGAVAAELGLDRSVPAPLPVTPSLSEAYGSSGAVRSTAADVGAVRSPRRWMRPLALAVAACTLGVVAGVAGTLALDTDDQQRGEVLARAPLAPLPAKVGSGVATLAGSGTDRTLRVDVSGLPAESGFYEVWVLDPETLQMQSLGVLRGERGEYAVPGGLDLRRLSVVDVSLEPYDGDPTHSRNSVVRGTLPT